MIPSENQHNIRKVFVPSRYRSFNSEDKPLARIKVTCKSRRTVCASSPKSGKSTEKNSLVIHDSVASIIRPETDISGAVGSFSTLRRSLSMSDVGSIKCNRSCEILNLNSTLRCLCALEKLTKGVVDNLSKTDLAKEKMEQTELKDLQIAVGEKRRREAWMVKWLDRNKSIEGQLSVLQKLLAEIEGDRGLLRLLHQHNAKSICDVSNRLPTEKVTLDENSLDELKRAVSAQSRLSATMLEELDCLRCISKLLEKLRTDAYDSSRWVFGVSSPDDADNVPAKLTKAADLCAQLASLRAHRLQLDLVQKLGVFSA